MNKVVGWVVIFIAILTITGCKKEPSNIEGAWAVDLEPITRQARSLGASNREIEHIRNTFRDGELTIDSSRITLTIAGIQDSEVFEYKIDSKEGDCLHLVINSSTHRYCTTGDRLEVHDPSTKIVVVYKRI